MKDNRCLKAKLHTWIKSVQVNKPKQTKMCYNSNLMTLTVIRKNKKEDKKDKTNRFLPNKSIQKNNNL